MDNMIVRMFEESGMTIREFAKRADLKYSTAHDIVKGKANIENIGAGAFVRIAKVFGTTADALMGAIDEDAICLTPSEMELLSLFRQMNTRVRELLMDNARAFAQLSGSGVVSDERVAEGAVS